MSAYKCKNRKCNNKINFHSENKENLCEICSKNTCIHFFKVSIPNRRYIPCNNCNKLLCLDCYLKYECIAYDIPYCEECKCPKHPKCRTKNSLFKNT